MRFEVAHTASTHTPLTCNCLLRAHAATASSVSRESTDPTGSRTAAYVFHVASYELQSSSASPAAASVDSSGPHHTGECATYVCTTDARTHSTALTQQLSSSIGGVPSMPGVFDLVSVPSSFLQPNRSSTDALQCYLAAACTDGSVRLFDPLTLASALDPLTHIHAEMITSCTPLYAEGATSTAAAHLLCSAHTGAVVLYSIEERRVTHELEGHEFDAWCTAVLPTDGRWLAASAAPPFQPCSGNDAHDDEEDGPSEWEREEKGPTSAALLASGGDDGLCKLYDMRCNCRRATSRMRFDAGVVSITPVLDTGGNGAATALPTPYLLVGSYDESIALVDVRNMRAPVARRGGLGGGVWRTSRCLCPLWPAEAPSSSSLLADCRNRNLALMVENAAADRTTVASCGWVNTSNVLVLPLMQRGAALLPYDVRAASTEVFGDAPLDHFMPDEEAGAEQRAVTACRPAVTDMTLVYDIAVLQPLTSSDKTAVVATASFYEKRIDVWSVRPAQVC
ncbi:hypothetical protein ABB37_09686 [Leptomonas pyrrhocoris]|uniref:methylated diphthine methylhydrolase n=1 Tax=Leptomonas pyrrhocoris TaxID=157538 RepID=A0A0M9FQA3_LEPPY|nr:hypothetical protein ABB37_09686 [Leptomonas pyrrhocoris]XP_015652246.1 hypothetical protein ABB37_09686 [Leptomonas pyrrhocoris]KPA73806.1 hypothetical protein ABB37_09686 [Leptomonas pyrrhocoris]KPA73807.1 hypothetical protein ABB37_09686 [Leptomonas pyrrhocoris]|eukprot:XP_015652245.1 hypothetical protein ABB37_09686 [Leptomonas pyrrhocoris]